MFYHSLEERAEGATWACPYTESLSGCKLNGPHHLFFIWLGVFSWPCTWCSVLCCLKHNTITRISSVSEGIKPQSLTWVVSVPDEIIIPNQIHIMTTGSRSYILTADLWPWSQLGRCWECHWGLPCHGWSQGRGDTTTLYSDTVWWKAICLVWGRSGRLWSSTCNLHIIISS